MALTFSEFLKLNLIRVPVPGPTCRICMPVPLIEFIRRFNSSSRCDAFVLGCPAVDHGEYNIAKRARAGQEVGEAGPADLNIASRGALAMSVIPRSDAQLLVRNLSPLNTLNNINLKWRSKSDSADHWSRQRCGVHSGTMRTGSGGYHSKSSIG